MAVSDEINRVQYISEDFQTYRQQADDFFAAEYPEAFNNLIATDLGNAIMDQIAFAMMSLAFMVNRRSSELFLSTALFNKSITKLARMLGYPIMAASPASTDLTITLPDGPYAFQIPIPIGFQFQGPGDTIYEYISTSDFIVSPGVTVFTIPVKEGQSRTASFVSDGTENQQFSIFGIDSGQYMYSSDLTLTVDGTAWQRQDLIKFESLDIYEILFTEEPPKLRFGDGIAGNIPPLNSQVFLSFRYGKGGSGAIGQNQITGSVTPLVVNGETITMEFANPVANVGSDPEDIRHVKAFASTFFRTQNAAVVKQDYDSIAALETGVSLADAQIQRGIDTDVTIQSSVSGINSGIAAVSGVIDTLYTSSVTGLSFLGVSGISGLGVSGIELLGVSGQSALGISGINFLGVDGGNVTGISYLGVTGQSALAPSNTIALFVGGIAGLGVSGISSVGITNINALQSQASSGFTLIEDNVSGLLSYLSQTMSDTSKANNVQVIILSTDANNRYVSPSITTLQNVQSKLRSLADAVVTVFAVDGISKIVPVDIAVELGINQVAVKQDVQQKSLNALTGSVSPFGLLVKRTAGVSLYVSDIEDAIRDANTASDIRYINVKINGPTQYLDSAGNLIINRQQIIQDGTVTVTVKKRFMLDGEVVDA